MSTNVSLRHYLVKGVSLVPLVLVSSMLSANDLSPARQIEVSVVRGEQLPALIGKNFANYSVMTVSGDALSPIPFQFDERNEGGFIYAPGGKLKLVGTENVLDAEDELVFMLHDAGEKASPAQLQQVAGKKVSEVQIDVGDHQRYVYVIEGNAQRSDKHYTYFDKNTGLIKTSSYSLQVEPNNLLMWSDFFYKGYAEKKSILDTMKIRAHGRLGFVKATINNKLIPNKIVAVKNGPVRSIIEMDASIGLLGINIIQAGASVTITENSTQFPVFITIPKAAAALSYLDIEVSLDMNDMEKVRYRTQLGPKEPVIQGGGGADPKNLKIDLEHNWLSASSNKNWDIIAFFNRNKDVSFTLEPLYKDAALGDEADSPERYEGSYPQAGYIIKDIPTGVSSTIGIDLYYNKDFWQGNNVEVAAKEIRNPAKVSVNSL